MLFHSCTSEQITMQTSYIFVMKKSTAFLKVEKYLVSGKNSIYYKALKLLPLTWKEKEVTREAECASGPHGINCNILYGWLLLNGSLHFPFGIALQNVVGWSGSRFIVPNLHPWPKVDNSGQLRKSVFIIIAPVNLSLAPSVPTIMA